MITGASHKRKSLGYYVGIWRGGCGTPAERARSSKRHRSCTDSAQASGAQSGSSSDGTETLISQRVSAPLVTCAQLDSQALHQNHVPGRLEISLEDRSMWTVSARRKPCLPRLPKSTPSEPSGRLTQSFTTPHLSLQSRGEVAGGSRGAAGAVGDSRDLS